MKKKILLIEDDLIVRENTAEILSLANYKVYTAVNGKDGVEKAIKTKPDIIICDIIMPKLDGYGVYKIITQDLTLKHIPFIFLSAKTENADRRRAMELGADDYLTKPFNESELLNAIEIRIEKQKKLNHNKVNNKINTNNTTYAVKNIDELVNILCKKDISNYKKGETLFSEYNRSQYIYLIKDGIIKTFKTTRDGKEFITSLYKKREFIGYYSSLDERKYSESASALHDSKVIRIHKDEMKEILTANPHLTLDILSMISNNMETVNDKMLHLAYSSVRERIAKTIMLVADNIQENEIFISRADLANLTGIAKETLIRTLSDFKEENVIKTNRNSISILDKEKLMKIR